MMREVDDYENREPENQGGRQLSGDVLQWELQKRPTVFAVQEVLKRDPRTKKMVRCHNLLPALQFGNLEILMDNRRLPIASTEEIRAEMEEKLAGFTAQDFLLPVGDPVLITMAGAIASEMTGGTVQILKYDRASQQYYSTAWTITRRRSSDA